MQKISDIRSGLSVKKLRIYLDTSVIGYLDQQDEPEKMKEHSCFGNF